MLYDELRSYKPYLFFLVQNFYTDNSIELTTFYETRYKAITKTLPKSIPFERIVCQFVVLEIVDGVNCLVYNLDRDVEVQVGIHNFFRVQETLV